MAGARALAAAVVMLVTAAGCGGNGDEQERSSARADAKPVGTESAGSVVQFANCDDWRRGTEAERFATIEALRGQLTPQRSATAESPLSDQRAYEILDRACTPDYAGSLRLYKLYVRAQGFAPLND